MTIFNDIDIEKVLRVKNAPNVEMREPPGYKSKLKRFQKKGVAFCYTAKRSGLFDSCGTGKTHIVMALACLLKSRDELGRCLYLLPAADILAKAEEFATFSDLNFAAAVGPLSSRLSVYNSFFDVTFVSYEVARGRDFEYLKAMDFDTIILDESHVFRNSGTKTAEVVLKLTEGASRVVTLTATPIQMSLVDIYTQSKAWHHGIFGTEHSFKRRYVVEEDMDGWRGIRRFSKRQIVGYKNLSLPMSAPVLTPRGWQTMQDMQVGSVISTPDGGTAIVEKIFDLGEKDIWKIVFSDGSVAESTLDHLWTVQATANPYRGWQTLPLKRILELIGQEKQGYRIPASAAWEPVSPVVLPLDPYLLGVLLGDGGMTSTPELYLAHGEEELLEYVQLPSQTKWGALRQNGLGKCWKVSIQNILPKICRECGCELLWGNPRHRTSITHAGRGLCNRCYGRLCGQGKLSSYDEVGENPVTLALRELHIQGCVDRTKFVPPEVFVASSIDRRSVLQGLLDTDGWVSKDGTRVHFVSSSAQLAMDVTALVRSLGGVSYTRRYRRKDGTVYYKAIVRLSGELFRLRRKAARLFGRVSPEGKTGRYLRGASFDRVEDARCIKISSEDGLFITNDYVPTHNSEFKRIINPFFLRRSIADVEDELPELIVLKHWGALLPAQKTVYEELRKGTVQLICNGKRREARKNIHSMQMVVNSTAALGVEADYSWKMDWLMAELHKDATGLGGSMANDKIVVFAQHKSTLRVLAKRLKDAGIGYVVMTGDDSKEDRQSRRQKFWTDTTTQVMIGTTALECSMNLHCARFMVALDSLPNPQRIEQLVGRIRRTGSVHKTVVFVMLLTNDTFEEKLHTRLEKRQATVDKVFVESSDIFSALSDFELTQLFTD